MNYLIGSIIAMLGLALCFLGIYFRKVFCVILSIILIILCLPFIVPAAGVVFAFLVATPLYALLALLGIILFLALFKAIKAFMIPFLVFGILSFAILVSFIELPIAIAISVVVGIIMAIIWIKLLSKFLEKLMRLWKTIKDFLFYAVCAMVGASVCCWGIDNMIHQSGSYSIIENIIDKDFYVAMPGVVVILAILGFSYQVYIHISRKKKGSKDGHNDETEKKPEILER